MPCDWYYAVVSFVRPNSTPDKFAERDVSRFGFLTQSSYVKIKLKRNNFYRLVHFISFTLIHSLCGLRLKQRAYNFCSRRTPAGVYGNLKALSAAHLMKDNGLLALFSSHPQHISASAIRTRKKYSFSFSSKFQGPEKIAFVLIPQMFTWYLGILSFI